MWQYCGWTILGVYLLGFVLHGGVYRPRGVEWGNPAFYLLPTIALIPVVTWFVERRRGRRCKT